MRLTRAKSLIGLDIGTHSVKAVELTWSNGPVITGFGYAELPSPDAVPETVLDLLRDNEFHSRRVVTSVSGRSVIVRYLTMFKMSPDDLRNAIRYEADKYIPFDEDEVVLDCQPFEVEGVGNLGGNEMRVLLVACRRAVIDEQLRILAAAGLQPELVDVDVFALGNAFELAVGLDPEAGARVSALVDVGATKTCVNLMRAGVSLFTREIHTGGTAFTTAIAGRLSLAGGDAEALKRKPGDEYERVRQAVAPAVDDLASEVRLSFEYFENQFDLGIDEVLLSGGGSRLAGIEHDFARIFERPTMAWDPTGDFPIAAGSTDMELLNHHVPELAVAVGLASRIQRHR
ncbi:MAG: type IV pilus assembly protein PilM [Planctomycetota bacterium]|nr:type IV pilus assembly protein PilM [Planctomycetota bacterium]